MKIIDLLNKIANGEEVPEHIKIRKNDWYFYKSRNTYGDKKSGWIVWDWYVEENRLNDEVEILEEEKKIPKEIEEEEIEISMAYGEQVCANKINEIKEILDYLKENDDKDNYGYVKDKILAYEEGIKLVDYITNLQEEKDSIDDYARHLHNENKALQEELEEENRIEQEDFKLIQELEERITNLQEENEKLKEQNNDLRKIYRNTYQRLFDNGNDELARYFQAQIDDCPTFYVEPIIDYHKEWKDYKSRNEKAIEYINKLSNEPNVFGHYAIDGNCKKYLLNILNDGDE